MRAGLLATATVVAMTTAAAGTTPAEARADRDRKAILDLARIPAQEQIGRPIKLVVERLKYEGNYAFLFASMQDAFGRPIDYAGTRFQQDQENGVISNAYAALLKRNGRGGWTLITSDIGPTDESWTEWPARYGAPAGLFKR